MNYEKPKNGLHTEHYDNGQIKLEISFKDGIFFGKYTSWHENGQKKEERNSIDGGLSDRYSWDFDYILDWKYDNYTLDPYTNGKAIYCHENGQKQKEANFIDGKQIGRITYWYENGQIRADGNYIDCDDSIVSRSGGSYGELYGKYTTWYENGQIRSDQTLIWGHEKDSILEQPIAENGKSTFWYVNGQKSAETNSFEGRRNGKISTWYENGQIRMENYHEDDNLVGKFTLWYENGIKENEKNYEVNLFGQSENVDKSSSWYENGQIKSENFYIIGEVFPYEGKSCLNDKSTEWYKNGQKKSEINYIYNSFGGKYKTWHENGNKKEDGNYHFVKASKDGKFTIWHEDGSKKSEIHYKEGGRHGKSITWDSNGAKSEENYINGRFISPLVSIKDKLNNRVNIRFGDIESGYWRRVQPVWFVYDDHIDSIDNKIINHQFSPEEEEQILSLINLQELFRLIFSPNGNEGTVTSSEIKYEYPNKSGHSNQWDMPISFKEVLGQWRSTDTFFDENGLIAYQNPFSYQTENKHKQFYDRFEKLNIPIGRYNHSISKSTNAYKIINTWLYTLAEDIVEQWTLKNNLDYHDYNTSNQYAPQDCRIAGVDVDVKTTTGIGRQNLKNFYRYKSEEDKTKNINEIIIGISSRTEKNRKPYLSDTSSSHVILGIYDPSIYSQINLELKHFKPSSNLVNVCYFQSLESYFKTKTELDNYKKRKYDPKLIDYLTKTSLEGYEGSLIDKEEYIIDDGQYQDFSQMIYDGYRSFLPPIIYVLLDYPVRLGAYIKSLLPKENHDLIPIIVELASKKKLQLLPHYFADYLLDKILSKEKIDEKAILPTIFSLIIVCDYQKVHALIYIKNLFKLAKILPNVRCKWHPNETMKDMSLSIFHNSYLPTVMAKCSHHPKHNTTIFTYSWKTGETLFYGQEDTKNCDLDDCGCLIHQPYDNKWYGRKNCKKYGQYSSYEDA